jgi:hypothetical protein
VRGDALCRKQSVPNAFRVGLLPHPNGDPSGVSGIDEGSCLSFDGQLGYGAQRVADLDAGGLLAALQAPVTAQGSVGAQATGTAADQDRWVYSFTPYIWLPASASALSVGPLSTSFSVGPFQGSPFGLMGHFDAKKGKWGYFIDLIYSNAFYGGLGPLGNTSVLTAAWLGELGASYRLAGPRTPELLADWGTVQQPPTCDVYFGIKGFSVTESLTVNFPLPGRQNASRTLTVAAPMVGVRARWDLSDKWSLLVDANVAGLGGSGTYIFGYGGIIAFSYKVEAFHLPAGWSFGARVVYMNMGSGDLQSTKRCMDRWLASQFSFDGWLFSRVRPTGEATFRIGTANRVASLPGAGS